MTLVQLREFLLSQPGATEDTPFGPEILVYRIAGKMFALVDWQAEPLTINLKCEPELALLLREIHQEVKPGWHMNKQHIYSTRNHKKTKAFLPLHSSQ